MVLGWSHRSTTVAALVNAGLAPSTKRFYTRVWHQLHAGYGGHDGTAMSPGAVASYLADLYRRGCSSSTMFSHSSAIAYGHKIRGLADPTTDFRVKQLLKGAAKLRVSADRRQAVSLQQLLLFCDKLDVLGLLPAARLAFRAIFLLGFFCLLRPGELVKGGTPRHTIQLSDLTISGDNLSLRIPSSKTSAAPHTVTLTARPDVTFCPVRAVRDFLRVRPRLGGQLFVDAAGRDISTAQLTGVLKQVARLTGVCSDGISGHCLRIGGASHGALRGMSELQLAEAGRWRSRAVRRYVRRTVSVLCVT